MSEINIHFEKERATTYDQRFEKIAALKDVLHLTLQMVFQQLPERSRVLVVGAGTGAELLYLAHHFPQWEFTAVEPSGDMLEICRQKVTAAGYAERCEFHHGYTHQLPLGKSYDGATSLLVSHFLLDPAERVSFFEDIGERLRPGGTLFTADLAQCGEEHDRVWEIWLRTIAYSGTEALQLEEYTQSLERGVSLVGAREMKELLGTAGFQGITHVLRTILINAWFARRG